MYGLLWVIPALPFLGYLVLALVGRRLPRLAVPVIGAGSVGLSAALSLILGLMYIGAGREEAVHQQLWEWFNVAGFAPGIAFTLDPLSIVMICVVSGVSFLIHLYSAEFMCEDPDYSRFFAYLNLFVGMMLVLVLADNLLLLYLGWEGVGLCSYLLIGFWYKEAANGYAARKAFVVTRVGDTAMAIGLFLLFAELGTLNIAELMERATTQWQEGSPLAITAAALLLGGAVGKSAQLPLQVWLPDAMAGPTPVSALIHAATMVTAGVYLIARTHALFLLAPPVMLAVAIIGAATLLIAGFTALTQSDIKRVLAYSTISQIGYMFLALGVGAWSAAIFHLMTHAFFKALLFLGAGAIIHCLHHEHNLFRMGGLRHKLPVTYWTFLIGGGALAGFPLITAGFYSKDLILWHAWNAEHGGAWLWAVGYLSAFITSVYIFRLIFLAFFGEAHHEPDKSPGLPIHVPLIVLATLSVLGGFVEVPASLGGVHLFSHFMEGCLPAVAEEHGSIAVEVLFQFLAAAASLGGIAVAWWIVMRHPRESLERNGNPGFPQALERFWYSGWGFDALYDFFIVRPFVLLAQYGRPDFVDYLYRGLGAAAVLGYRGVSPTQTGRLRWYAGGMALGTAIILALVVLL